MDLRRIKSDAKYIFINRIVMWIPSWSIRRFFLQMLGMRISNSARIGIGCIVINPENIVIGDRTIVNEYCHLDGRGGLTIANDVSISIYTRIITASHYLQSSSFEYYSNQTYIGERVWIGCGAIILDGTKIEKEAVIGAGSVFKGVAKSGEVYVGNPAIMIKERKLEEEYQIKYKPYFR